MCSYSSHIRLKFADILCKNQQFVTEKNRARIIRHFLPRKKNYGPSAQKLWDGN